jgi:hypothetical protein
MSKTIKDCQKLSKRMEILASVCFFVIHDNKKMPKKYQRMSKF